MAAKKGNNPQLCILDTSFLFIILETAAVKECILLARMPVEVAVQNYFSLLMHVPDELFSVKYGRVQQPIWLLPLAVEVAADEGTSVISVYDAIWVKHGHNPNHKVLSQLFAFLAQQLIYEPIHHMRRLWFAGVHSAR